jgi:toxin-antitoxin system PIN domain toxin
MAATRRAAAVREPRAGYVVAAQPAGRTHAPKPVPRRALLDVNVLIALLDADHLHHTRASAWLSENIAAGWASCAITQNGCVRIMSQPGYPNALPTAQVAQRLRDATDTAFHHFVPGDLSLLDVEHFDATQLLGHRQVTDAYLLGLAVRHDLRFVTFDGGVPRRVVRGLAAEHVVVL